MVVELDQSQNGLDGKAQLVCVFDESQTLQRLFSVATLIAFRAFCPINRSDLLVVTGCLTAGFRLRKSWAGSGFLRWSPTLQASSG